MTTKTELLKLPLRYGLYLPTVGVAVAITWLTHEFGHWTVSEILGYDTVMSLNSAYPSGGVYQESWHALLISAAGPAVTLLQALLVFGHLLYRGWNQYLYPFLFVPFYMRLLAGCMNVINLNDEGRIGSELGIGTFTLPLLVSVLLLVMVVMVSKKFSPGRKFQIITLLLVMITSSIWILADQFLGIRLID